MDAGWAIKKGDEKRNYTNRNWLLVHMSACCLFERCVRHEKVLTYRTQPRTTTNEHSKLIKNINRDVKFQQADTHRKAAKSVLYTADSWVQTRRKAFYRIFHHFLFIKVMFWYQMPIVKIHMKISRHSKVCYFVNSLSKTQMRWE